MRTLFAGGLGVLTLAELSVPLIKAFFRTSLGAPRGGAKQ